MQFTFKKKIGDTEFTFTEDATDIKEFFRKVSFVSELPSVGPNGETDLVLQYRTTKSGDDYYSIVSKKADQELKLGQHKGAETLFVKGWEEIYKGSDLVQNTPTKSPPVQNTAPVQNVALAQNTAPIQTAPVQNVVPTQNSAPVQNTAPEQTQISPQNQQSYENIAQKYGLGQN